MRSLGIAVCLMVLAAVPLVGQDEILSGFGTAVVDGVKSVGEWDAAGGLRFDATLPGGGVTPASVHIMNDETNLYIGVEYQLGFRDSGSLELYFDHDNDGAREIGDASLVAGISPLWLSYAEHYLASELSWEYDPSEDGMAEFENDGGVSFYEISHPLNPGDEVHDFGLSAGETIGFRLVLYININDAPGAVIFPGPSIQEFLPLTISSVVGPGSDAADAPTGSDPDPVVGVPVSGDCLDESEPNDLLDEPGLAFQLVGSTCVAGSISEGDHDFFEFEILSAQIVELMVEIPEGADTVMYLYNGAGEQLAWNDDLPDSRASYLRQCLEPGSYSVEVVGYDPAMVFDYNLVATISAPCSPVHGCGNEIEPNDDFISAQPIGEIPGFVCIAASIPTGDADMYVFDVLASAEVTIETELPQGGDTVLTLFDATSNTIATNDDAEDGRWSRIVETLDPGTYYVLVMLFNPTDAFEYYLRVASGDVSQSTDDSADSAPGPVQAVGVPVLRPWTPLQIAGEPLAIPGISASVCVVDWNGDALLDLLVGNYSTYPANDPPHVLYFQNVGAVGQPDLARGVPFEYPQNTPVYDLDVRPSAIDWDGNGILDLLVGNSLDVFIHLNQGAAGSVLLGPRSSALPSDSDIASEIYYAPHITDWNEDGLPDLLVGMLGSSGNSPIYVFLNAGTTPLQFASTGDMIRAGGVEIHEGSGNTPFVVDWNDDQMKDLIIRRGGQFLWCRNTASEGTPVLEAPQPILLETGAPAVLGEYNSAEQFWVIDWNSDGILDIVAGNYDGEVGVFLGVIQSQ